MTAAAFGRGTAASGPLAADGAAGDARLSPSQRRRARRERRSLLDTGTAIARNARDEIAERAHEIRDRRGLTSADRAARDDARDELERRARVGVGSFEIGAK